ncbi:MAG: PAS domain S-box protein [Solirubrobacteraceae bacterium]
MELAHRPPPLRHASSCSPLRRRFALEVEVRPIPGTNGLPLGVTVSFSDITALSTLAVEHQERKRELETAYEEPQSINEELETMNEELQSINEELRSINEELQSTNDELEALIQEQQQRATELDRVNLFPEGILTSVGVGVIVTDRSGLVQVWNGDSTELWGLRAEEVEGKPSRSLDTGMPVAALDDLLDGALHDGVPGARDVEAVNRRGGSFTCAVTARPLLTAGRKISGVLQLMIDREQRDGMPTLADRLTRGRAASSFLAHAQRSVVVAGQRVAAGSCETQAAQRLVQHPSWPHAHVEQAARMILADRRPASSTSPTLSWRASGTFTFAGARPRPRSVLVIGTWPLPSRRARALPSRRARALPSAVEDCVVAECPHGPAVPSGRRKLWIAASLRRDGRPCDELLGPTVGAGAGEAFVVRQTVLSMFSDLRTLATPNQSRRSQTLDKHGTKFPGTTTG